MTASTRPTSQLHSYPQLLLDLVEPLQAVYFAPAQSVFTISRFRRGAEGRGNFVRQFKYLVGGEMVSNISIRVNCSWSKGEWVMKVGDRVSTMTSTGCGLEAVKRWRRL